MTAQSQTWVALGVWSLLYLLYLQVIWKLGGLTARDALRILAPTPRSGMMRLLFVTLIALACFPAFAGDAVLTWTAPTQRTDGTALTNLDGYKIYYGTSDTALTQVIDVTDQALTTYTVTGLTAATWYFAMTAYDATGSESAKTGTVSKTIVDAPPNPPGGLTVSSTTVSTLVKQVDRFMLLPVGTVPAGTGCDSTRYVSTGGATYYVVPRSVVAWSGTVKPDVVFAPCS